MNESSKDPQNSIGLRLRKIRKGLDLNLHEMADRLAIKSYTQIGKWENDPAVPRPAILKSYSELGNTTVDALLSMESSEEYQPAPIPENDELARLKSKYLEVLEENRELHKEIKMLKAKGQ